MKKLYISAIPLLMGVLLGISLTSPVRASSCFEANDCYMNGEYYSTCYICCDRGKCIAWVIRK
jgi:hypothetical protein